MNRSKPNRPLNRGEVQTERASIICERVLGDVAQERLLQDMKWGQQNHPDVTGVRDLAAWKLLEGAAKSHCRELADAGKLDWCAILNEEFCEAIAASADPAKLRAELIQVAAVAVAWVECIDRRAVATAAPFCQTVAPGKRRKAPSCR